MIALGLIGSPVRDGNVETLVRQVLAGAASAGALAKLVFLNDLTIRPCQSCGPSRTDELCRFDDDMNLVYQRLQESDIVVLGSPVYFDTVSAQTKLMIDRCNCLTALVETADGSSRFERRLAGSRTGILVAVAGAGQDFGPIRATSAGFFTWIHADFVESILYVHDDDRKGHVRQESEWMARAFDAGAAAAGRHASSQHH